MSSLRPILLADAGRCHVSRVVHRIVPLVVFLSVASCGGYRRQVLSQPDDPAGLPSAPRPAGTAPPLAQRPAASSFPAQGSSARPISDGGTDAGMSRRPILPRQAAVFPPHPLAGVSDAELEARLLEDPASLGPLSLGRASSGALFNGKQMPTGRQWRVVSPPETWGTDETIDALIHCIARVNEQFPDTPPIHIGDISRKNGGHHAPHTSHQSGRDVDLGYYYNTTKAWYTRATEGNLDLPRTWALVRALITETDVQAIFMDHAVQKLLRAHAEGIGEDPVWLDDIFGGPASARRPLITHEPGHRTHLHVRFYNPVAQETGRRVYPLLIKHSLVSPPTYYVKHKARSGDTLGRIARQYGTSVTALKKANQLRSSRIYRGRTYKIPRRGGVSSVTEKLVIPARRLPPLTTAPSAAQATQATPATPEQTVEPVIEPPLEKE